MAYAGIAAGAAGSLISTIGNLIKKKVKAPDFVPVNTGAEAGKAINANLTNLPASEQLAGQTNAFNESELLKQIRSVIPNFDQLTGQIGKNTSSQLAGELPADVVSQIYRHSGAVGVANGTGGSQFAGNLTPRDLGLNSLQLMQQGFQNANSFLANVRQNATAPLYNPANMFISPAEQIQVTSANNAGQYNSQFLQNQLKAAQAPASIVGAGLNQFGQSLGSLGSIGGTGGGGTAGEFGVSSIVGSTPPQTSGGYGGGGNFGNGYGNWWGTPSP